MNVGWWWALSPLGLSNASRATFQLLQANTTTYALTTLADVHLSLLANQCTRELTTTYECARHFYPFYFSIFFSRFIISFPRFFFSKATEKQKKISNNVLAKKRHQKMRNAAFCFIKVAIFTRPSVGRSVRKEAYTGFYQRIGG